MKLIKGLQTDTHEQDQPSDSYIWALNWVANQRQGSLVAERGFTEILTELGEEILRPGFRPVGIMPTADKAVIFSTNEFESEIGIYDEITGIYTPRLNNAIATALGSPSFDTGLLFSFTHQIKSIYRFNFNGDLEIAFTDWNVPPRILTLTKNIGDMNKYYTPYDINKLNIFQTALFNKIDTTIDSSGNLIADAYFVFYRYKNIDQTVTNTYVHPEPQYIIVDNNYDVYSEITGNDIGVTTNKAIKVTFGVLDSTFPSVEVGLYRVSTAEAKIIVTIPTNQVSASLLRFEGTTIQTSDVISPRIYYSKVKTLSSLNDVLYLGNLSKETFDIPQKYVNNIRLKWTCKMIDPVEARQGKDYNIPLKTFMANEVYSFLIRFRFKTGDYSTWKHIPGRKASSSKIIRRRRLVESPAHNSIGFGNYTANKTIVQDIIDERGNISTGNPDYSNYQGVNPQTKYFQTIDTCEITASNIISNPGISLADQDSFEGNFSYWENDGESYGEYYTGEDLQIWNNLGLPSGDTIISGTNNDKVRHHKFPSLNFIEKNLPNTTFGISSFAGSTTRAHFANTYPQFGVKLDLISLSDILPSNLLSLIAGYEIGFSARDFNNATVYGQDLSLFGVYTGEFFQNPTTGVVGGYNPTIYLKDEATKDAIYFTGSNNVGGGVSPGTTCAIFDNTVGPTQGNLLGHHAISMPPQFIAPFDADRTVLSNWTHAPFDRTVPGFNSSINTAINQIPNRQRFHTPDLVDPLFPVNNPSISPTHIRHEVMIVTGQKEASSSQITNPGAGKMLYMIDSSDSNFLADNTYSLIDYCGERNRAAEINKNTTSIYSTFCLKNIPDAWVHRNIKAGGYVPKTTLGVVIGDNPVINTGLNVNTGGGDLYGGTDHYHIQMYDRFFPKVPAEKYAEDTNKVLALYSSFLTNKEYSGAGIYDFNNPTSSFVSNMNHPFFYNRHAIPSLNVCRLSSSFVDVEKQHHSAFICSIQRYATSVYNKFYNLDVINTLENPNEAGVFLGDCFISEVNYVTSGLGMPSVNDPSGNPYVGQNFTGFKFYAHTRRNLDYRYQKLTDTSAVNQYYPASRWNTNIVPPNITVNEIYYYTQVPQMAAKLQPAQALNYASTYGTQPTFNVISSVYANPTIFNDVKDFPFRIHASEKQAKESQLNNWRVFLALNYYENDKTKGEITNLQGYDDQLLIHTIQSLFFTRDRGNLQSSDLGITIGTGGIFDFPPKEVIYNNLGYTGTQHQFGCSMTKLGYVFPDAQQGKFFVYNKDSGLVELSNLGMFNFFKEFGKTLHNDYSNNKASGLSAWNTCFDEYNGRILIGNNQKLLTDPKSYTLSYTDGFKSFTSFHSYFPDLICNTRQGVYSFKGSKFYKHNTANKGYYVGDTFRNELDVVFNTTPINTKSGLTEGGKEYTKLWQSFNWQTEMHTYSDSTIQNLETFTQASVRTKKQCSELIDLEPFGNTRIFDSAWYFNAFRDRLNRTGIRSETFAPFVQDLNNQRFVTYPINNPDFNSRFIDTYVILRLIYNGGNLDREMHLLAIDYTNKVVKK